jgi:cytidine kinase
MSSNAAQSLLVVGSIAFDRIRTPRAESGLILGGSATYGAVAASYFAPTRLVGVVGTDFGDDSIARLKRRGICLEGLEIDRSGKTFYWSGHYGENFASTETLEIQLNVFEKFHPKLPAAYRSSPFVMLGNIQPQLQAHVLDQMEGQAFVAADTRDLWIELTRPQLLALLPRLDLFVLNDDEAPMLTGEANVIKAGRAILELGPRMVLIKKGGHGCALFSRDALFAHPAYPVEELHDPTGAGDSFLGALMGRLAALGQADFRAVKQAIPYATAAASLTVEAFGLDRLESEGRETIEKRATALKQMVALE